MNKVKFQVSIAGLIAITSTMLGVLFALLQGLGIHSLLMLIGYYPVWCVSRILFPYAVSISMTDPKEYFQLPGKKEMFMMRAVVFVILPASLFVNFWLKVLQ